MEQLQPHGAHYSTEQGNGGGGPEPQVCLGHRGAWVGVLACVHNTKEVGRWGRGGRRMAKEAMTHLSPQACLRAGKRGHTTNTVSDAHKRV